jgi:hypothetical protein
MSVRCHEKRHHTWAVVASVVLACTPIVAAPITARPATQSAAAPAWPCRLVIVNELRPIVQVAWERSPTFRSQCERLADAGTLVLLRRATSVQTPRTAQSLIGASADGVTVAQVLVGMDRESVRHIAHELEHILEYLDGVDFPVKASRHRSGITRSGNAYETERAFEAGERAAREVRESPAAVECARRLALAMTAEGDRQRVSNSREQPRHSQKGERP